MLVSYRFTEFLDEIHATLVVRSHHTEPFQQDQLWRCAADFSSPKRAKRSRIRESLGKLPHPRRFRRLLPGHRKGLMARTPP